MALGRIAIYGGSFNPPHVGHAMVASWLVWSGLADETWLVPVFRHAFDGLHDKELAAYADRLAWCRAMAVDLGDRVLVSEIESQLPAPSYTIDTLRAFKKRHPEHDFRLVVGSDVLSQRRQWKAWNDIERDFSPIVVARGGVPFADGVEKGSIVFPDVSSTDIRGRIADGRSIEGLVTKGVAALLRPADLPADRRA